MKNAAATLVGRTGEDLLGEDPNELIEENFLYRMATTEQYLQPLRCFQKRRALGNLRNDLMVPLGTAAFMSAQEVSALRKKHFSDTGVVHTSLTHPVSPPDRDAVGCTGHQCHAGDASRQNTVLAPVEEMRVSLDGLGWEKTIVNFNEVWGFIPMAHNQIAALTKFSEAIDGWLGFHEGRYLMDEVARWITA